ncbi:MAG TPA: ferredoxin [Anaerolineaceae bacterium]|nr:ferredoxin [Anaerolineaceae bacterium]
MKLRSYFYLLPNIVRAFFSKPDTVNYPSITLEVADRFRGSVRIKAQNCVGCSLCVRDCPAQALELEKESKNSFRLIHYRDRCTYCGQCELSCRFDAIFLDNEYDEPSSNRAHFIVTLVERVPEE